MFQFIVVNAKTMKIEFEGKVGDHVITDIKLSPDNKLIAFGSSNGNIYVHFNDFTMNFKQISCVSQHSEGIYSMDFSTDSSSIQSCSLSNHTLRHCEYYQYAENLYFVHMINYLFVQTM